MSYIVSDFGFLIKGIKCGLFGNILNFALCTLYDCLPFDKAFTSDL